MPQKKNIVRASRCQSKKIKAIDLFCGVGGLTRGLEDAGIEVVMGVDIDPACKYPYTANNKAAFVEKSIDAVSTEDLSDAFDGAAYTLLAGCAPCQPFSSYRNGKSDPSDKRWHLLRHFGQLVEELDPDFVTMENVPRLAKEAVFSRFVSRLKKAGFQVSHEVVNCADYGVPQHRDRLVLIASKHGPVKLISPTVQPGSYKTVRDTIEELPPLKAGESDPEDPLHQASILSPLNLKRIRSSKAGGTWRDWDKKLVAACHKKKSGKTYPSVYGRMAWDDPSPTMTTQFFGFGNGRFGHPRQNRAISLREGALLQSFPLEYTFVEDGKPIYIKTIGRLIGNAVPVELGKAIGKSLIRHVQKIDTRRGSVA